jgi:Flp pilus assembly protein TadG
MSRPNLPTGHQRKGERGSVVIMTALSMLLLILMVGLCIDISRIYTARTELQNAADAAAVAAARELDGTAEGIQLAVDRAGQVANTYGFGKGSVTISEISFAKNLYPDADYKDADDADDNPATIRFVRVRTGSASTDMLFASRALGPTWTENRQAVAGSSPINPTTLCDFFPAAVALKDLPKVGDVLELKFNQGTGNEAVLNDKDYIILEVPDITGNGTGETAELTAGLENFCKTLGDNINMTPSSNKNNGPRNSGDGINTRFNEYANGYGNALKPNVYHPDSNIATGITHQDYRLGTGAVAPTSNTQWMEHGRRYMIMPIILPNGPPPLQASYPAYTTNIQKWVKFFLKDKAKIIQGNCSADPLCGAITVEVVEISGPISPVVPTAESSSLTLPVIFR